MERAYFEDEVFEKIDYSVAKLPKGDYDSCSFLYCNFSNADLSNINFTDCEFRGCNMSIAKLTKTAFKGIEFIDCKLMGLHFEHCEPFLFAVSFDNCVLNFSSFYKLKLKKTRFKDSSLHEADFTDADLSLSVFENSDLARATFDNTNLEKADFRTSYNYAIDPSSNILKKAKFSLQGIVGLLYKYDIEIHT